MATRYWQLSPAADDRVPALHDGVLVVSGYGIQLRVERGHLLVDDGIGAARRQLRFTRLDRELKRVVIIGHAGVITLDAIRWLHGVGVPLVHLDTDGRVFLVAAPAAAHQVAVRRAQALAAETGLGVRLSLDLIAAKVKGQCALLKRLPATAATRCDMTSLIRELETVRTSAELRRTEGLAARAYWSAWKTVPIRFRRGDLGRCPHHWLEFQGRTSPLPGWRTPRQAVTPANAVLNYLYAILEGEARIAALAVGLDPMLGLLHADHSGRDALALDLMEPVRPAVDAFVLDFLERHTFARDEVFETLEGQCRLLPPLTIQLAATAPRWARLALPVAQELAARLRATAAQEPRRRAPRCRRAEQRVMREYSRRLKAADDPRYRKDTAERRQRIVERVRAADREWEERGAPIMSRADYLGTIAPQLQALKLSAIMAVTGLSNASCSMIRRGQSVPHPRHWAALERLAREGVGAYAH